MRSHRIQKSGIRKRGELGGVKIEESMRYSIFKYSNVTLVDTTDYKPLQAYMQPKGNVAVSSVTKIGVSDFSEDLKTTRRSGLKTVADTEGTKKTQSFTLDLAYQKKDEKYLTIQIKFTYENSSEDVTACTERVTLISSTSTEQYQLKDLVVDSDITEYLFRFTKGYEWNSETYAILDCNPNQSVEKGVYLTLNAPFNSNIKWGDTKRKLILAYKLSNLA